jgi:hypothetical protein
MNSRERQLLQVARTLIDIEQEQFVCCAVDEAYTRQIDHSSLLTYIHHQEMKDLREKLEGSLNGPSTLEQYLYQNYGIRPERTHRGKDYWDKYATCASKITYLTGEEFAILARQCRLAWIDRMLDNNEVK